MNEFLGGLPALIFKLNLVDLEFKFSRYAAAKPSAEYVSSVAAIKAADIEAVFCPLRLGYKTIHGWIKSTLLEEQHHLKS